MTVAPWSRKSTSLPRSNEAPAPCRILAYAPLGRRHRQPGQHKGPITRAFLEVLEALLWGFHNSRTGCCYPSYEAIAAKAECARSTVAEALKALEWAGVLTWQNRIARIHVRERDLFGRWASRWRVIRTSNAYVFRDPQQRPEGVPASKSENPPGTLNQEILDPVPGTSTRSEQPIGARLAASRQHRQSKIAHEQERRDGPCHLTNTAEREKFMPRSKHRRKPGGKAVAHPGRGKSRELPLSPEDVLWRRFVDSYTRACHQLAGFGGWAPPASRVGPASPDCHTRPSIGVG